MTYQLPSANTSWSTVFQQLEDNKERLSIIDYSVSQTTLEQVSNRKWFHTTRNNLLGEYSALWGKRERVV